MSQKAFVQAGEIITALAPYTLTSGSGALTGNMFGVAMDDIASGVAGQFKLNGVWDLAKDTSTFTDESLVYWDNTAKKCTSVTSGNTLIGIAVLLQPDGTSALGGSSGDATVRVRLDGTKAGTDPGVTQTAVVSLTAAQILAMFGTPVSILPAPGAGKAIVVENIAVEIVTTATQFASGGVVHFYYHGLTVELMAQNIAAASVNAAAGTATFFLSPVQTAGGSVISTNLGIDITNATAAFTTGTGTMKVFIKYRTITL
jgi:predicted RecA/RadA family phage recombinase